MAQRAGKYDALLPNLPKLPEETTYQERINEVKKALYTTDATELASGYVQARRDKANLEEAISQLNWAIAAYEQLLADSQERGAAGWGDYGVKENALRLPSGETVRVQEEPYAVVKDREALRRWALANGYESQLQLMWQTTNSLCKERLQAGDPEPDGCETFRKTKVVYVKGTE